MSEPDRVYTVRQVADLLGVRPATVRAYASRRQMPEPLRRAGHPVWDADVIDRWAPTRRGASR